MGPGRPRAAPVQLRRDFRPPAARRVARARLYATALGLYEAHVNGRRVGTDRLAPGWTDYRKRVPYRTHDVTDLLRPGANAIGMLLAPGWYAGSVGRFGPHQYGEQPLLLAQLKVTYTDSGTDTVTTGPDWRCVTGPSRARTC
ncbi:hypothetical protein GCM10010389_21600 [Streptomyces echinoruber]|uniref:Bacterial alpha-L-rhamnosidase N-terminal domain-containing protein n=1 Tax=Streptomyces echinoruber TaxID=68898 RepID=A0A918R3P0_9ACTN|nr:hypothetical protein GCM10010389_21600 [Streptomyces echinoruber]